MPYDDGYETVEISDEDMTEAQRIIIEGLIREGEFKTRESLISLLEKEVSDYLAEVDYEPNIDWIDGVRYVIHLLKEVKSIND